MFLGSPSCVCVFGVQRLCWRDLCLSAAERKTSFISHAELKSSVHHNLLPSSGFTRREPRQEGRGHWGGVIREGRGHHGGV